MNNEIREILENLSQGKISAKKAAELIREINPSIHETDKKASRLKITIIDKEEGKEIKIPGIPFWLITSLGNFGLKIASYAMKHTDTIDKETHKYLDNLNYLDLNEIFSILKNYESFDIVNIEEKDGDEIRITTL